jgi:hypothetical protein
VLSSTSGGDAHADRADAPDGEGGRLGNSRHSGFSLRIEFKGEARSRQRRTIDERNSAQLQRSLKVQQSRASVDVSTRQPSTCKANA